MTASFAVAAGEVLQITVGRRGDTATDGGTNDPGSVAWVAALTGVRARAGAGGPGGGGGGGGGALDVRRPFAAATASWRPLAVVVAAVGPPAIPPLSPTPVAVPAATVAPVEAEPPAGLARPPITATGMALPGYRDPLGPALVQPEAW